MKLQPVFSHRPRFNGLVLDYDQKQVSGFANDETFQPQGISGSLTVQQGDVWRVIHGKATRVVSGDFFVEQVMPNVFNPALPLEARKSELKGVLGIFHPKGGTAFDETRHLTQEEVDSIDRWDGNTTTPAGQDNPMLKGRFSFRWEA